MVIKFLPFLFHVNVSRNLWPSISMSSLMGTSVSGCSEFSLFAEGSKSSYTSGNVRTFLCDNRLLLTGVEHGTASKWWELLGRAGIQFAFFCLGSLQGIDQNWIWDIKLLTSDVMRNLYWWKLPWIYHPCLRRCHQLQMLWGGWYWSPSCEGRVLYQGDNW